MPRIKPAKKISANILTKEIAPVATLKRHVRLVMSINNAITFHRVTVEGALVTKWTPTSGFLVWENKEQPVTGTLDVGIEVWGTPDGEAALATVCDESHAGTLELVTPQGQAKDSASYNV